ncbi:MAG TPA: Yip1 family protein [Caldilineaceae bacterium]|nr:Yip1 family protein [Caldilineaceae bacterium]
MDFAAMFDTWRNVLLRPGEEVFVEEKARPTGTLGTALIWMIVAAVIAAILGWLRVQMMGDVMGGMEQIFASAELPPEARAQIATMFGAAVGAASLWSIILVPIGFLITVAVLHLLASVLGGSGDFGKMGYLRAAYQAPLIILSSLVGLIPFLGGCISFLLWLYGFVLTYFAVKVNYNLTSGRAIAVVLIPLAVVLILTLCAAFAFAGILVSIIGNQ